MSIAPDVQRDLIFDVGLNDGGDTRYYLHQGYRVLAIEADPQLAAAARLQFAPEIDAGRLVILNLGIAEQSGKATFWICDEKSFWNSFDRKVASRNGLRHHAIEIETRRFGEILSEFGVPYYLKVDIEGNDHLCIQELQTGSVPPFISVEAECVTDGEFFTESGTAETLDLLRDRGYRKFKLIYQGDFSAVDTAVAVRLWQRVRKPKHRYPFAMGNTGPWGNDTPGRWLTYAQARKQLGKIAASRIDSWHDWHARV